VELSEYLYQPYGNLKEKKNKGEIIINDNIVGRWKRQNYSVRLNRKKR
jgi:hypothetical protein